MDTIKEMSIIPKHCIEGAKPLSGYASDVLGMQPRQRDKLLLKLTKDGQAEYLHAVFSMKNVIDIEAKAGALLTMALNKGHEDVIDVLLHHGADPKEVTAKNYLKHIRNRDRSKDTRVRIMQKTVKAGYDLSEHVNDIILPMFKSEAGCLSPVEEMLADFFGMGVDYQSVKRACLNNGKEYYCDDLDKQYKKYQHRVSQQRRERNEEQVIEASVKVEVAATKETANAEDARVTNIEETPWHFVDENSVALVQDIKATKTSIQTVFNFEASSVTTIVQVANSQPNIHIRNFDEVENQAQLMTAFNQLTEMGGAKTLSTFEASEGAKTLKKTAKLPSPRLHVSKQN